MILLFIMNIISYKKKANYNHYNYNIMDNSNKNVSVTISPENLEKLKFIMEQLNIPLETNNTVKNTPVTNNSISNSNAENIAEDILEPINLDDNDGSDADFLKEPQTDTSENSDCNIINDEIVDTNSSKIADPGSENTFPENPNEITPEDILTSDEKNNDNNNNNNNEDEFDLDSDLENSLKAEKTVPSFAKKQEKVINTAKPLELSVSPKIKNNKITIPVNNSKKNITQPSYEVIQPEKKLTINIGGKKFNLKKDLLEKFNINYGRLQKIIKKDGQISYFLDRDPYYFSKIIEIVKMYGFQTENIAEHIDNFSEQLVSELCQYGLLDKKLCPKPKLKLKRIVSFPSRHEDIIKIITENQLFETTSGVLSRSNFFENKLKMSRTKQFYLTDVEPKFFRYVINFLRNGELYVVNDEILKLLNLYGVEYDKIENKKLNDNIVSHYTAHNTEAINNQLQKYLGTLGAYSYQNKNISDLHFSDNNYYHPVNLSFSSAIENINFITSDSEIKFDSEIIFNLADKKKFLGESIEDLLLCIDLPVLKPTESVEYVDNLEYNLVNNIAVIVVEANNNSVILQTNSDALYMHPVVYKQNYEAYHEIARNSTAKNKMIYENNLIDIHRITLPLFLLKDRQNHIPVSKIMSQNKSVFLIVKMAPLKKIFKNKIKEIPLLNVCLIANYINFPSSMPNVDKNNNIIAMPLNNDIKKIPQVYVFDKLHTNIISIPPNSSLWYDIVVIPLAKFGLIKDFYFTIVSKEDFIANRMDKFSDDLIEMEILNITDNEKNDKAVNGKNIIPYCKLDAFLLNQYIPLKKLGYILPQGVYYYTFSSDPTRTQILGALNGIDFVVRLKIKKTDGIVKFFVNEYIPQIF